MTAARKTAATKPSTAPKDEVSVEEPKTATFEYKGISFTVASDPLDQPFEVALAESEPEVIEAVLGPDQWLEFRKTRPTMRQFGEFSELVLSACGYEAGN
ncbi:hypothetical protein AB0D68_10870 [Streptomyces sp. NPDC048212]|uniref:hypothetical protein n=1 Tax=Streptomyces sp. NPDC048212 TaxID=3156658 RepID=UPI0033E9A2A2